VHESSNPPSPPSDSTVPSPRTPSAILPQPRISHADHTGSRHEHAAYFFLPKKERKKEKKEEEEGRKVCLTFWRWNYFFKF